MTSEEFDQWVEDLGRKFPAISKWFREMEGGLVSLLADWSEALDDVDLADALTVNRRMLSGDDDGPGNFPSDWQRLPAIVRRHAQAHRYQRVPPLREGFDFHEPRYKCLQCLDRGTVFIAHHAAVMEVLKTGELRDSFLYRVSVVLCDKCDAGGRRRASQDERAKDPKWANVPKVAVMCENFFPVGMQELRGRAMVDTFVEWVKCRKSEWESSKRFHEFDTYNAGTMA